MGCSVGQQQVHFSCFSPLKTTHPCTAKPGKNWDGWFTANHLLVQVNDDIFDRLTGGYAQGLFLFDNAPSQQKQADDALLAHLMVKGASLSFGGTGFLRWMNVNIHVAVGQCAVDRLNVLVLHSGALPLPFADCSWCDFGHNDERLRKTE